MESLRELAESVCATTDKFNKKVNKVKGLNKYSKTNILLLINTFNEMELEKYIAIENNLRRRAVYKANDSLFIQESGLGLGVSKNGKTFQLTNHTLFTLLKELKISPLDLTKIIKE